MCMLVRIPVPRTRAVLVAQALQNVCGMHLAKRCCPICVECPVLPSI
jgi:hypothetical protein